MTSQTMDPLDLGLPAGTVVDADPATITRFGGRVVMGGAPFRLLRLSPAGAAHVQGWFRGEPVPDGVGAQRLARRLVVNGMAHPRAPTPRPDAAARVTVVIPVKDDPGGLARTLDALSRPNDGDSARGASGGGARRASGGGGGGGGATVIVVDDGSAEPVTAPGARIVRNAEPTGPAAARQRGLHVVETDFVAFVDAGVSLDAAGLDELVAWFHDPAVVAVAPRVVSAPRDDLVGRVEQTRSPLDLGPTGGPVGQGRPLSYVPTAALVARTDVVRAAGGFDPALRYGEDVDLVWRLERHGSLRYVPAVQATHEPRADLRRALTQRYHYGTAAGPLAARHGSAVAPMHVSGWSLAVMALVALRRPVAASFVAAVSAWQLGRKLKGAIPDPYADGAVLTAQGHRVAAASAIGAAVRPWWPVLVAAQFTPLAPLARRLALGSVVAAARRTEGDLRTRGETLAIDVLGDLAYSAGVWRGSLQARSAAALLPRLMTWPNDSTH
ncbi:MAG: glycosyltransferase [Actinomycetota bacterium]